MNPTETPIDAVASTSNTVTIGSGVAPIATPIIVHSQPNTGTGQNTGNEEDLERHDRHDGPGDDEDQMEIQPVFSADAKQYQVLQKSVHRLAACVQLESFKTFGTEALKIRLGRLEQQFNQANELYMQIMATADIGQTTAYEESMLTMEQEYFEAIESYRNRLDELSPGKNASQSASEVGQEGGRHNIKVTMPPQQNDLKNTWGEFDGTSTKWLGFRDRFLASVHNNQDVDDAHKLRYLVQSLKGPAAGILGEADTAADSYLASWDRVYEMYQRPYKIARDLMRRFYRLPHLQGKPTAQELQTMSNVTHDTVRQLRALEYPVETFDIIFVLALHDRLDVQTATLWNKENTSDYPQIKDMLKFLDKEAGATVEPVHWKNASLSVTVGNDSIRNKSKDRLMDQKDRSGAATSGASGTSMERNTGTIPKKFPCEACPPGSGEYHQIFYCPNFLALNRNARLDFVTRRKLCPNCLKKGHNIGSCTSSRCSLMQCRINPYHNSLLCPFKQTTNVSSVAETSNGQKRSKKD